MLCIFINNWLLQNEWTSSNIVCQSGSNIDNFAFFDLRLTISTPYPLTHNLPLCKMSWPGLALGEFIIPIICPCAQEYCCKSSRKFSFTSWKQKQNYCLQLRFPFPIKGFECCNSSHHWKFTGHKQSTNMNFRIFAFFHAYSLSCALNALERSG